MKYSILTIIALMFVTTISKAQSIPNGGFENWSNPNGYQVPDNWGNLNSMTAMSSVYTCSKGTPGNPGSNYLKLVSKNVTGMGVMPGIAVSGILNESTFNAKSGFPYTKRPTALTGKWQHMGASLNDVGYIKVYMTKWNLAKNKRDTIGFLNEELYGMVMSWENFNFSITYFNSDIPDSCIIIANASGIKPEENSYLFLDNLELNTNVNGISEIKNIGEITVHPNPSSDFLNVNLTGVAAKVEGFEILSIDGKIILSKINDTALIQRIPIHQLTNGEYLIRIITEKGIVTQKFIKK